MNEVKTLRLAAGLTQRELSVATGIYTQDIVDAERNDIALSDTQWTFMQYICDDRIKMFKRDAGGMTNEALPKV